MIKCVIFDCDGTLVDSEYLCNLALEINLAQLGIQESAISLMERYRGWKLSKIFDELEAIHSVKLNESKYRSLVAELFDRELKPIEGVSEALSKIQQVKCVASSAPLDKIEQALRVTNLSSFFGSHIFSSYIVKSWKPDPHLFLYAAQAMNFHPEECAVIEDSEVGLIAATKAGMQTYFFNPQNLECKINDVISFDRMIDLPSFFVN
jgi:HAD superfamily hydrolase (TIGR01509 family)